MMKVRLTRDLGNSDETMRAKDMNKREVILGSALFDFYNFQQWVDKAQSWYSQHGANGRNSLALDAKGRCCLIGKDFMRARDEDAFPVTVYQEL